MNLKSEVSRLKNEVNKLAYATHSGYEPRYLDPLVVSWADFLLRDGPLAAVPEELQEDANTVAQAARILDGLLSQ